VGPDVRVLALAASGLVLLLPAVAAHGDERHLDDQLLRNGERLMVGGFDAAQPGPLVVVPYVDGPLTCESATAGFLIPLSAQTGVTFLTNATHLLADFDLVVPGYTAFAVDTADAVRSLIMMEEQAVALHALASHGIPPSTNRSAVAELRAGVLGIPYRIPGASVHSLGHDLAGGGIAMQYGPDAGSMDACESADRLGLLVPRSVAPSALEPGRIVHVVALHDPDVPQLLPRPLDSTEVLQANLYLARPGEDPEAVREGLEAKPGPSAGVAAGGLILGLAWVTRRPGPSS
jgi:hypothetical protein